MNVGQLLLDLHECLCTKIAEKVLADPDYADVCACTVQWSDTPVLDHCGLDVDCGDGKCGQGWVRFVGVEPDPEVDVAALKCVMALVITMEIGIGRCTATLVSDGMDGFVMPTDDDYLADVVVGTQDMDVITQAVLCCGGRHKQERISIASITPGGPEGGCFWTSAIVTARVLI